MTCDTFTIILHDREPHLRELSHATDLEVTLSIQKDLATMSQ